MSQAALPLAWPDADHPFVLAPSNAAAVRLLERPAAWPVAAALLVGPRKSGRSLLARHFARRTGGRVLDDAERQEERTLFDAWNDAQATRRPLLIVADAPPPEWPIRLPDLRSRLAATPLARIEPPDDSLVRQLIPALLDRRGLVAPPEVVAYLSPRAPRTHHRLLALVDALDTVSLAKRRPLTVPLAREALQLVDAVRPSD